MLGEPVRCPHNEREKGEERKGGHSGERKGREKTAMWELTERGFRTYVRTFPGPAELAGLTDVV